MFELSLGAIPHSAGVSAIALAPDGETFATTGEDQRLRIFERDSGAERHSVFLRSWSLPGLAYSSSGDRVVTGAKTVGVYDVRTKKRVAALKPHRMDVRAILSDPDGSRIWTATGGDSDGGVLREWREDGGAPLRQAELVGTYDLALSPDRTHLLVGAAQRVSLIEAASLRPIWTSAGISAQRCVAFGAGGSPWVGEGHHLLEHDRGTGKIVKRIELPAPVRALRSSADGTLFSLLGRRGADDVSSWVEVRSGETADLLWSSEPVAHVSSGALAVSRDGRTLAVGFGRPRWFIGDSEVSAASAPISIYTRIG